MFATALHPRRTRAAALRGLACGLALAAGLSTLAGGGGAVDPLDPDARPPRKAAQPRSQVAAEAGAAPIAAPAFGLAASLVKAADKGADGFREPPPYAPGGDDVLNVGEPQPHIPRLVPLATGMTNDRSLGPPASAAAAAVTRLMLWLDRARAAVGERVVLHVAASGATECHGMGALQAVRPAGTRVVVRPMAPGRHLLSVSCQGDGGRVEQSVTLIVPLPVHASSQQNRQHIDFDPTELPSIGQLAGTPPERLERGAIEGLHAAGDFFQEGRHAVFMTAAATARAAANAYFLARDDSGRWVDRSAELLPDPLDRNTCGGPSQAITADFNLDGKPDVYVACQGASPLPGDAQTHCCRQVLFLSQYDGQYRRVETAFSIQARQAEAADVDGDGLVDIMTTDTSAHAQRPLLLLGRGDGRFVIGGAHLLPDQGFR